MSLTQPVAPDRNHIAHGDLKHWAKHWNVEVGDVRTAISKVGNSVSAVQKELAQLGLIRPHGEDGGL